MYRLLKGISWIFLGNIIASLIKWLILVLIARILTPYEVGAYSLAFALTAPIALFTNLKLRSLYITEKDAYFSDYLFARNITSIIALLVVVILGLTLYPEYLLLLILVGLNKFYDLHSELFYSHPHIYSKFGDIGKLMILKHIILIIFFAFSLYLSRSLIFSLAVQAVVQILVFYFIEKKIIEIKYRVTYTKVNYSNVNKIIKLGLPLGLSLMIVSLYNNFPRYILEYSHSQELLGYFSAIAYIVTAGNLLMRSVSQNFLPILTRLLQKGNVRKFKVYVYGYLPIFSTILGIILIFGSSVFGRSLLTFVYGSEYSEYIEVLILISIAVTINFISWNFDTALMAMRYISIQPKISVVVLIVSIVLSIYLVNKYSIYGAAMTIIVTNLVQLILRVVFVFYGLKKYKYK
ncbi:hypothetical protein GCM10010978_32660 [Compostibacillus humi]|uniref:O-antigen/teichoic acid export membrane protein n=1 Tax=Compostibacillus humi TaxID=1245525 RepID=A0A8J2TRH3_9BACI|nr:oligosaccharide flippase family protein [Compostibacillus humi]GFZ91630.1 hypothetical protein GCM10010978_32660 [Compostibacillus humi]